MQRLFKSVVLAIVLLSTGHRVMAKSAAEYWTDTRDYIAAPLHWDASDWRWAGGAVVSIAAAYSLDEKVHDHFVPDGTTVTDHNSLRDALPLATLFAGTYAFGKLHHDDGASNSVWDMGEAVALGTLSSQAFKLLIGRERPGETDSPHRFGHGGDSFPSGHTTVAFAAAQVLADEMPQEQWGWKVFAYGLAGATAYARLDSNAHWLSDTVAGAALGISTGRFVSHRGGNKRSKFALWLAPLDHGAMISFAVDPD
jgi:membrane-associated phospholipid phosphatase